MKTYSLTGESPAPRVVEGDWTTTFVSPTASHRPPSVWLLRARS